MNISFFIVNIITIQLQKVTKKTMNGRLEWLNGNRYWS